jgi:hypothetical protein
MPNYIVTIQEDPYRRWTLLCQGDLDELVAALRSACMFDMTFEIHELQPAHVPTNAAGHILRFQQLGMILNKVWSWHAGVWDLQHWLNGVEHNLSHGQQSITEISRTIERLQKLLEPKK